MLSIHSDEHFMKKALQQAKIAYEAGEIPVGAVVVARNQIIASAHNQTEMLKDVTAHAEILAITAASNFLNSKYLRDCTLYVTLEPCSMCAGALFWSQINRIFYAAPDEKRGFMKHGRTLLHPQTKIEFGIMQLESSQLMKAFFQSRR